MTPSPYPRPEPSEHSPAVADYLALVPGGDILPVLTAQPAALVSLVGALGDAEALVHHAPYTWSIKQVVGHMVDCDTVFGYRALRLARNDKTPLPGFDENAYMAAIDFDRLPLAELVEQFQLTRRAHLLMLRHLSPAAWSHTGTVNDHPFSVRAVAYVMAGHAQHHLNILAKRLGK